MVALTFWSLVALALAMLLWSLILTWRERATIPPPSSLHVAVMVVLPLILLLWTLTLVFRHRKDVARFTSPLFLLLWAS
jgi:hypothetical protein